jgi:hypothetical protein
MDNKKKAEAMALWHGMLDDRSQWSNPAYCHRFLVQMVDDLLAALVIDPLERFDMFELANAAFNYFSEDGNREWRHPASDYAVYNQGAVQVGSLHNTRYIIHSPQDDPYKCDFFAMVKEDNTVITRTYAKYGVLEGRHIYTETGQTLTLVERSRNIDNFQRQRLDDADRYRALIDAATLALERGDFARYVRLWERYNFSVFRTCSRCRDRFDQREDCEHCDGRGFVDDPHCPSKLPPFLARMLIAS